MVTSSLRLRDELLTADTGVEAVPPALVSRAMGKVLHGAHIGFQRKPAWTACPSDSTGASLGTSVCAGSHVRPTEKLVKERYSLPPFPKS